MHLYKNLDTLLLAETNRLGESYMCIITGMKSFIYKLRELFLFLPIPLERISTSTWLLANPAKNNLLSGASQWRTSISVRNEDLHVYTYTHTILLEYLYDYVIVIKLELECHQFFKFGIILYILNTSYFLILFCNHFFIMNEWESN